MDIVLKLVFDLFGLLFLLFLLLSPLFLILGALLVWKGSSIVRGLGWLLIFLVAYYKLSWSPWYIIQASNPFICKIGGCQEKHI
jgi:hypothetical protein